MIPFFVPDMPTCKEVMPYLERIDQYKWYSNYGPLVNKFTEQCAEHFEGNVSHVATFSSGTAALESALAAMHLPKEMPHLGHLLQHLQQFSEWE